jgi:hypothetical protein
MTEGDAVGKLSSSDSTPKISSPEPTPKNLAMRGRLATMAVVLKIILLHKWSGWRKLVGELKFSPDISPH